VEEAGLSAGVLVGLSPPQATRPMTMTSARISASAFFMLFTSSFVYIFTPPGGGKKTAREKGYGLTEGSLGTYPELRYLRVVYYRFTEL
jgi:hypothetical protein